MYSPSRFARRKSATSVMALPPEPNDSCDADAASITFS